MRGLLISVFALFSITAAGQLRLVPKQKLDSVANPKPATSELVVSQSVVDLGRVAESAVAQRRVAIKNNGTTPLVWHSRTTCRCLTADRGALRGGESAEVVLQFAGKGFPGPFDHKLFIYEGNDSQKLVAVVRVKGYVVADADRSGDYPYHCAGLLLRRPSVNFDSSNIERIACINGSQRAVKVRKDDLLSSAELDVKSEPEVLQPGQQGDLVITLTGEKRENLRLYIYAEMAPRTREIKVE